MTLDPNHRHVIALVPDEEGGINRLFQTLVRQESVTSNTDLAWFDSTDKQPLNILRFPGRLVRFFFTVKRGRFDLCHINLASRGSTLRKVLFASLCRTASLPYVIHLHGGLYREFHASLPGYLQNVVRTFFIKAERVIVLGSLWRDFVINEIGVDPSRVVILPNAVAGPTEYRSRQPVLEPRFLFLGRLGTQKGTPELLQALADPQVRALDWQATIAGDGDVEELRKAVTRAGLAERIEVPGWVGTDEVEALLKKSDILLLPSHAENLPLSMLEGMANGLCPVVTPVGAIPDVIRDGENGLLVPVNDPDALASAMIRLVKDTELRRRLSARARSDFEACYDIRDYQEKLETIYLDVCRSGKQQK